MANRFQSIKSISQFLQREQFVEIDFYPTATGRGRAQALPQVIISFDERNRVPGEEEPPVVFRRGGIRIEVFPPGASRPIASMETEDTLGTQPIPQLLFDVTQATPGWRCRFRNLREGVIVDCELHFPKQLHSTAIPLRVLNNAASQLIAALGLKIHLDGDRSFLKVSDEIKEFAGDRIDQQIFFDAKRVKGLTSSFFGLLAKQNDSGNPTVRIELRFGGEGEVDVPGPNAELLAFNLTIEIELFPLVSSGESHITTVVSVEPFILADLSCLRNQLDTSDLIL